MIRLTILLSFLLFALYACNKRPERIMTPTIFSNGLIQAAFDRDSTFFLEQIETPTKIRQALKLYKDLRPAMKEYETIVMSDNSQYNRMKDSALIMYHGLVDSIQKFGLKKFSFDTVDFNNYVNNYRPYFKLDADGYIYQNNNTYVLKIREAMLLTDGWNLGSVVLFQPAPGEILLRVADSLREASKKDPRGLRTLDSLKKINYQVKENPFLEDK